MHIHARRMFVVTRVRAWSLVGAAACTRRPAAAAGRDLVMVVHALLLPLLGLGGCRC